MAKPARGRSSCFAWVSTDHFSAASSRGVTHEVLVTKRYLFGGT